MLVLDYVGGNGTGDSTKFGDKYMFPTQPASSENGSGVKKLGALVDYNDSDSDEGKLSHTFAQSQ